MSSTDITDMLYSHRRYTRTGGSIVGLISEITQCVSQMDTSRLRMNSLIYLNDGSNWLMVTIMSGETGPKWIVDFGLQNTEKASPVPNCDES